MKLGVVLDPLAQINYKKDSTLAMMASAQKLGWEIFAPVSYTHLTLPTIYSV